MKAKFEIVDHSSKWKDLYLAESRELIKVFEDLVSSIHHIGSTARPQAKSKPEIDILVVLKDVSYLSILEKARETYVDIAYGDFG